MCSGYACCRNRSRRFRHPHVRSRSGPGPRHACRLQFVAVGSFDHRTAQEASRCCGASAGDVGALASRCARCGPVPAPRAGSLVYRIPPPSSSTRTTPACAGAAGVAAAAGSSGPAVASTGRLRAVPPRSSRPPSRARAGVRDRRRQRRARQLGPQPRVAREHEHHAPVGRASLLAVIARHGLELTITDGGKAGGSDTEFCEQLHDGRGARRGQLPVRRVDAGGNGAVVGEALDADRQLAVAHHRGHLLHDRARGQRSRWPRRWRTAGWT